MRQLESGMADRAGLGWRGELAPGILANLDRIDALEVIADDFFQAPPSEIDALRLLAARRPLYLHGVGLGLASAAPVEQRRLDKLARLAGRVRPAGWSEHLAFVRGGGREIGHLMQPPRNAATAEGACANIARASRACGLTPEVENIATLLDPPSSVMTEAEWLNAIAAGSGAPLLLDLHNIITNAANTGYDARQTLAALPLERVRTVHIAGGRPLAQGRILDDHKHPVPEEVFSLLVEVARRAEGPLTVLLERDGEFPDIGVLLAELDRAREAMAEGRRSAAPPRAAAPAARKMPDLRTGPHFEAWLARIYTDAAFRESQSDTLRELDPVGLRQAVESLRRKRDAKSPQPR